MSIFQKIQNKQFAFSQNRICFIIKLIFLSINQSNMENNENIQYRKLRDPRCGKTGRPDKKQRSTSQNRKVFNDSIMKRNVIEYQHLLKNPLLHLKQIDWVSKLREPCMTKLVPADEIDFMVPSVFAKTTQNRLNQLSDGNVKKPRSFNTADFHQVLGRKQCASHVDAGGLSYMTNLRTYEPIQKQQTQEQKIKESSKLLKKQMKKKPNFCALPYKQKNLYPKFILKQSLKKMKDLRKEQFYSALDGCQNYPPYTQKAIKQKNYGVFHTFIEGHTKQIFPTLAWEMGLRG